MESIEQQNPEREREPHLDAGVPDPIGHAPNAARSHIDIQAHMLHTGLRVELPGEVARGGAGEEERAGGAAGDRPHQPSGGNKQQKSGVREPSRASKRSSDTPGG